MIYEVFIENFTNRFKIGKRDLLREKMEEWEYEFYSSEFKINKFVCKRYINRFVKEKQSMYIIYFEEGPVKIIEENLGYCIINNRLYLSTHYDMIYEYSLDNVVQIIFNDTILY